LAGHTLKVARGCLCKYVGSSTNFGEDYDFGKDQSPLLDAKASHWVVNGWRNTRATPVVSVITVKVETYGPTP